MVPYLRSRGHDVLWVREPGGTALGERIRALLLDPQFCGMSPRAEMLLFAASRAQLVDEVIAPALAHGRMVVCDRFVDASLAYQGVGRGLGIDLVRAVNDAATRGLRPDLTVLLDVDPRTGLERARGATGGDPQGDRLEREGLEFHARVREGFLELARNEPQRITVIDARGPVEEVQREIRRVVDAFLRAARAESDGGNLP